MIHKDPIFVLLTINGAAAKNLMKGAPVTWESFLNLSSKCESGTTYSSKIIFIFKDYASLNLIQ